MDKIKEHDGDDAWIKIGFSLVNVIREQVTKIRIQVIEDAAVQEMVKSIPSFIEGFLRHQKLS